MKRRKKESNLYKVAAFFWIITILLVIASFLVMDRYVIISISSIITAIINFILGCLAAIHAEFEQSGKK